MDACDAVMDKTGSQRGLIRYASLNGIERGEPLRFTPRLAGYLVVLAVLATVLALMLFTALGRGGHRPARARLAVPTDARRPFQQPLHRAGGQQDLARNAGGTAAGKSGGQLERDGPGQHRGRRRKNLSENSVLIELDPAAMKSGATPLVIGVYSGGKKMETLKTAFIGPRN